MSSALVPARIVPISTYYVLICGANDKVCMSLPQFFYIKTTIFERVCNSLPTDTGIVGFFSGMNQSICRFIRRHPGIEPCLTGSRIQRLY